MRIRQPGKIDDGLWFLGREESCVYLLEGRDGSILINGGSSYIVPDILEQIRTFRIDESKINKLLILHSHSDHVGIVPFFKHRNQYLVIYASSRSLEIFKKPKAIQAINASSHYAIENSGLTDVCSNYDLDWWEGIPGVAVSDGDHIELGNMEVCILETPGHSPCSISVYVPRLKALFPSDAGGIPFGEKIITLGTSNFTKFEESLQKMKSLDVNYICSDHCGYVQGDEAAKFIADSIETAIGRRSLMLDAYKRHGCLEEAARELASIYNDENEGNIVPGDIFVEMYRQMIRHVAGLGRV